MNNFNSFPPTQPQTQYYHPYLYHPNPSPSYMPLTNIPPARPFNPFLAPSSILPRLNSSTANIPLVASSNPNNYATTYEGLTPLSHQAPQKKRKNGPISGSKPFPANTNTNNLRPNLPSQFGQNQTISTSAKRQRKASALEKEQLLIDNAGIGGEASTTATLSGSTEETVRVNANSAPPNKWRPLRFDEPNSISSNVNFVIQYIENQPPGKLNENARKTIVKTLILIKQKLNPSTSHLSNDPLALSNPTVQDHEKEEVAEVSHDDHGEYNMSPAKSPTSLSMTPKKRKLELGYTLPTNSASLAIVNSMHHLVNDKETKDVVFNVEGRELYGHKAILSQRSEVFKQMFYSGDENNSLDKIIVIEHISANLFLELLHYLYTGQIQITIENLFDIHQLADHYKLEDLKRLCRNQIEKILAPDTSIRLLVQGFKFLKETSDRNISVASEDIQNIYNEILSYTLGNARAILKSDKGYLKPIPDNLFLDLLASDNLNLKEEEVLEVAIAWLSSREQDQDLLKKVKEHIRFSCMDQVFVWKNLAQTQIWESPLCSQEELGKITADFYSTKPKNQRKGTNSWYISKCEKPFEVKSLGDDAVIMYAYVPFTNEPGYKQNTPTFTLGPSWYLHLRAAINQHQQFLYIEPAINAPTSMTNQPNEHIEYEIVLINQDARKSVSIRAANKVIFINAAPGSIPYHPGVHVLPLSRLTPESGFLSPEGNLLIQMKMKLLINE
jgi:hypothetical protein